LLLQQLFIGHLSWRRKRRLLYHQLFLGHSQRRRKRKKRRRLLPQHFLGPLSQRRGKRRRRSLRVLQLFLHCCWRRRRRKKKSCSNSNSNSNNSRCYHQVMVRYLSMVRSSKKEIYCKQVYDGLASERGGQRVPLLDVTTRHDEMMEMPTTNKVVEMKPKPKDELNLFLILIILFFLSLPLCCPSAAIEDAPTS
jgi:hypothetical protein